MHKLKHRTSNIKEITEAALEESGGLLRLAHCWVPRSFLHPGRRLKLHIDDIYAFRFNRGGILMSVGLALVQKLIMNVEYMTKD